jgi:polygalacturonase
MVAVSAALLLGASALVSAVPTSLDARDSCTFTDAAAAIKGQASCTNITLNNINVPAGTTLDLTKLKDGATVTFQGKTTFGYKAWKGPLISIAGNKITVNGASGHVIDCDGKRWWDGVGGNGGIAKPKFFSAHNLKQSSLNGLNVKNTPVQAFSINSCNGLTVDHITMDNSDGDTQGGHNTDAFDVGNSDGVTISNANIKNQDDCLAINSGTNIKFIKNICSGGHGISIGSVGGRSSNVVDGVLVQDSQVVESDNGIRIKTISGATGSVNNITYTGITMKNIRKYGIVIQQDYENGSPTGKPTTGVPITNVNISGVTGTMTSKGVETYVLCGKGSCSKWNWSKVQITGGVHSTKCSNIPSGSGASC